MKEKVYNGLQKPIEDRIVYAACIYWNVDREYFNNTGRKGNTEMSYRRSVVLYLLKTLTPYAHETFCRLFKIKSHSNSIDTIANFDTLKGIYRQYADDAKNIEAIASKLEASLIVKFVDNEANLSNG
ncbi:hypothetical protein [Arachidicoccus terrestris]|uniref:hypothetical protein n=1 Tax=Arachidicoccus terrestris TaxID=2875539 RepID=UPI001CC506C9|nr:hypothetical protein [Arachidicoccus terrestris]UAY56257.1 hypothetical protein K9M52_04355 [Arachidicoccus terrestris]